MGDYDKETTAAMAERRRCTQCGDVLRPSPVLTGVWLSTGVPVPGIGWPGERPALCRAGGDLLSPMHVPGELVTEG